MSPYDILSQYFYRPLLFIVLLFSIYLLFKKKKQSLFWLYLLFVFIIDLGLVIFNFSHIKVFIQNLFFLFYYVYFVIFVTAHTNIHISRKKHLFKIYFLFLIYLVIDSFFLHNFLSIHYNINNFILIAYIIITLELIYLFYLLKKNKIENIFAIFSFWIIVGNLFWNTFFILRIGLLYYFSSKDEYFYSLSSAIFTFVNIITYSIYLKGLTCLIYPKK